MSAEYIENKIAESMMLENKVYRGRHSKPVAMIDPSTNKTLHVFSCSKEALMVMGKKTVSNYISLCCTGKKDIAYGFKWKYFEENDSDFDKNQTNMSN